MKTLLSNTAFGHYLRKLNYGNYIALRMNYDDFLSQVLELWMFVPCELIDGIWTVLSDTYSVKPDRSDYFNDEGGNPELYQYNINNWQKYRKAKDRVLFEGFTYHIGLDKNNPDFWFVRNSSHKIHDYELELAKLPLETFVNLNYLFTLTPTAQKQIGL